MTIQRAFLNVLCGTVLIALTAATASSQPLPRPMDPTARRPAPSAARAEVVYRLGGESHSLFACFDPCDCALHVESDLIGTMKLSPAPAASVAERRWNITDVNWRINEFEQDILIRGEGTYTVVPNIGPLPVVGHRLELDLRIGDAEPVRYDSGLIAGGDLETRFPAIQIGIDFSDQQCVDRILTIDAAPVPLAEQVPYRLLDGSQYQQGCLPPCLCPIFEQVPTSGRFVIIELEPMDQTPAVREFAVVSLGWVINYISAPSRVTGSGFYSVTPSSAFPFNHRLLLGLTFNGFPERTFSSGWVPLGVNDPVLPPQQLDIDIALNGFYCYDEVFFVRALRP